jgi:hypothetical protein
MKHFQTSILERKGEINDGYQTQPFETAWASEAIFFIEIHTAQEGIPAFVAHVQISADGVRWVDEGACSGTLDAAGLHFIKVAHFGGWLRLRFTADEPDARSTMTIHLVLKE